jgi:hypothetical protein
VQRHVLQRRHLARVVCLQRQARELTGHAQARHLLVDAAQPHLRGANPPARVGSFFQGLAFFRGERVKTQEGCWVPVNLALTSNPTQACVPDSTLAIFSADGL